MGGEAQCGNIGVGSAYRKYPCQSSVANSEKDDDEFLLHESAVWFHRSRYVAVLMGTAAL